MHHPVNYKPTLGSALLSALFIMTLVAIAATAMSTRLQLDIYRTTLMLSSDKLSYASQMVTDWAMDRLTSKTPLHKLLHEEGEVANFPISLQNMYPDVVTKGTLYDLQAKFNVNNIQAKKFHLMFLNLLEHISTKMSNKERKLLLLAIDYWIKPYQPGRGHDNFLDFYLKQNPPYLPGYQPLQSISELRLIQGVDRTLYEKLAPYLTALPETTPININTASKAVLMSLGNGLTEAQVQELLEVRGNTGIKEFDKISELLQKFDLPREQITLDSTYFLSIATSFSANLNLKIFTVFKRVQDREGNVSVGIIRQSFNTF